MLTVKHQIPWCNNYTAWKWVVRHNDDLVTTGCTRGCHPVGHQHWLKRWITNGIIIFHLSSSGSANSLLRVSYSCYQPYNWIKSIGDISMQYTFHLSLFSVISQLQFILVVLAHVHRRVVLDYFHDVNTRKRSPLHWPVVRGIHRSPVNSLHKGQCLPFYIINEVGHLTTSVDHLAEFCQNYHLAAICTQLMVKFFLQLRFIQYFDCKCMKIPDFSRIDSHFVA